MLIGITSANNSSLKPPVLCAHTQLDLNLRVSELHLLLLNEENSSMFLFSFCHSAVASF